MKHPPWRHGVTQTKEGVRKLTKDGLNTKTKSPAVGRLRESPDRRQPEVRADDETRAATVPFVDAGM
jgi:hypothetical protein